ncbi:unnamed protein product [Rotaria magnacalcarata]|uniref:Uncharacterized protein n=1 Tax=Rotaria magnacalcarata TaxID=392030 RepID=A0A816HCA7_9BILA|nr:unnamed protein product [Rotaria magnacalcarata]
MDYLGYGMTFSSSPWYFNSIDTIFRDHTHVLWQQKSNAEQYIHTWATNLHSQVDDHVKLQKECLHMYFVERDSYLKERKTVAIRTAQTLNHQNNVCGIDKLLEECKNLKLELLAESYQEDKSLPFIYYTTKDQLAQRKAQNAHVSKTANNTQNTSSSTNKYGDANAVTDLTTDSFNNQTLPSEQQTNAPSSTFNSTTTYDRSISQNMNDDDGETKCPVCFMLYPPNLLSNQRSKKLRRIDAWEETQLQNIRQHASYQKQLLNEEYENECNDLKEQRQEFIETLLIHEAQKNTEQINRLIDCCKALQCELAPLIYNEQPTQFIHVTKRQHSNRKTDKSNVFKSTDNTSRQNSLVNQNYGSEHANNGLVNSWPTSSLENATHIHTKQSPTHSDDYYRSGTSNDSDQSFYDPQDDKLLVKCPTCFMIFPTSMTACDRSQHAQEHYIDD